MTNKKSSAIRQNVGEKASTKNVLYCYLRVSTQEQLKEGNSIEQQRDCAKGVAKLLDMDYFEMNDGGITSMTTAIRGDKIVPLTRPKFEEIKLGIESGEIKHLWYYSRSRWSRNVVEDMNMKDQYFKRYKTTVYEGANGSKRTFEDAKDSYMDSMFTLSQQFDREQRREVSVRGKRHKSLAEGKTGVFMGGTINYGYKNINKYWVEDEEEAKTVQIVFSMYEQKAPLKEIKTFLDSEGIKPRRAKFWSMGTIHTMLRNKVYLGEYNWKDKDSGEAFKIIVPQIISHSMFSRVQERLKKKTRNQGNNSRKYISLLSDFLKCYCGEKITGHVRESVNRKVYECASKHNYWKGKDVAECHNRRSMNMDMTDKFVVDKIRDVMGNSHILKDRFKQDVMSQKSIDASQIDIEKKMRENKIKKINNELALSIKSISTVEVNHMMQKMDDEIYEEVMQGLMEVKATLDDDKSQYIEEIRELDNRRDWIDWITRYGDDIKKRFENPTTELLEGMIGSIEVHPTFDKDRDGVEKQYGHKLIVNFKQPIVDDKFEYITDKKSDGYNIINGKKKLDVGKLGILKGGRGKSAKKNHRI